MPAKSKSQQRLFGMVHAYNKGELHGPKSLKARIGRLSKRISDEDAKHFAQTPHAGLPEKTAQVLMRPEEVQSLVSRLQPDLSDRVLPVRSARRRSFLGTVLRGTAAGTVVGGLGAGALGGYLSHKVVRQQGQPSEAARQAVMKAALRCGVWGAARGAAGGAALGAGLGILNTVRG